MSREKIGPKARGVLWVLFLTETNISVTSFMEIIMMAGIVVSNGILLVDYTNRLRGRGMGLQEAVILAGRTRLRPILMTTLCTILGLIPMAIGLGEGAESNAPMAIAVIGGLSVSTLLTLIFILTLYTIFEKRFKRKIAGRVNHSQWHGEPGGRPRYGIAAKVALMSTGTAGGRGRCCQPPAGSVNAHPYFIDMQSRSLYIPTAKNNILSTKPEGSIQ